MKHFGTDVGVEGGDGIDRPSQPHPDLLATEIDMSESLAPEQLHQTARAAETK